MKYCEHPILAGAHGHCSSMVCWNYVNRCPMHSKVARPAGMCNHELHDGTAKLTRQEVEDIVDVFSDVLDVYDWDEEAMKDASFASRQVRLRVLEAKLKEAL